MPRRGLVKCSSLFFIVFLMCPRRIRPTAPKQQDHLHALKKSSNAVLDFNEKLGTADWSNIVRQNVDEQGDEHEAGFDLSDDEIRKFKLWPKGIVPYYIDVLSFNDKVLRDRIRTYLNSVNRLTRLSFLEMPTPPKDDKTRWVFFVNRRGQLGCSDHSILNFTNEGVQHVNLGYDCILTGHELAEAVLSIVGVPPQHNSPDRDQYIKVMAENMMPEKRYLFHKLADDQWLFHDVKYDFVSASHFHQHKYSASGRATIEFQDSHKTSASMGNRGLTTSDIKKLKMLYNYIVMKKENKVPECDKLFRKGHNFGLNAVSFSEPKPRKKPNKYLGLPEEHHQEDSLKNEYDKDKNHEDKGHEDREHKVKDHEDKDHESKNYEEDTKEGGNSKVEEYTGSKDGGDEAKESYEAEPPATRKMDLKSHPMKGKQKTYKIDLLSYLSDYQTGDEHRRKAVYNRSFKGNK